jgi:hypothetical protein
MSSETKAVLAAAVFLGAALSASAKDKGPPRIDIERTCQSSTNALTMSLGADVGADFDSCVTAQKMALEEITRGWAAYPGVARARCVQPNDYLPGYVEWLVCLDMTRDVLRKRAEASAGNAGASSSSKTVGSGDKGRASDRRTRPERKECPIVNVNQDGSIAWVDACPLGQFR